MALGRLILYDAGGAELAPTSCAAPGTTVKSAACENLFDGSTSTQWRDDSFASPASTVGSSTLRVTVPGVPAQYEFFTLNKKKERDPVAWTVGVENTCGGFTQVGAESVVDSLANTRSASYGSFAVDVGAAPVLPESACLESAEYRFTFTGGAPRPAARPPAPPAPSPPPLATARHCPPPHASPAAAASPPPPPPPPAAARRRPPPPPPHASPLALAVRGSTDGVQLAGITLLDAGGSPLSPSGASGAGSANQPPSHLADANDETKWFDPAFATAGSSAVVITLASPARLGFYELTTANDVEKRDPTDWKLARIRVAARPLSPPRRGTSRLPPLTAARPPLPPRSPAAPPRAAPASHRTPSPLLAGRTRGNGSSSLR